MKVFPPASCLSSSSEMDGITIFIYILFFWPPRVHSPFVCVAVPARNNVVRASE
jgi:hypothetical protein